MAEQPKRGGDRVAVVINRSAGAGDVRAARTAFEPLRAAGRAAIRETDSAGVAPAVRTARAQGYGEIVVVGGDGSVQRSAREVAGNGTVLVPAPGGTLNHFARRHGIETLDAAAALVGRGRVDEVPLGVADDLLFLNTLVVGAYSSVLSVRERFDGVLGKWAAAAVGFLATLVRLPRLHLGIETADGALERTTAMLWIGMGRGSWPRTHRPADPDDPVLEVVVLRDVGRLRGAAWLLGLLRRALCGSPDPSSDSLIERFHARSLLITAAGDDILPATLDGDPRTFPSPLFVSSVEGALRIRTPS